MIYFNLIIPMYEYVEYPIYLIPYFLKCRILIVLEERIKVSECGVMIITCFFFWLIFKKIFILNEFEQKINSC